MSASEEIERVAAGTIVEYLHACPLCDEARTAHYCRVPSLFERGAFIRYERCRRCGIVFRNPRLPEMARLERYRDKPHDATNLALDPKSQVHYAYMLRRLERFVPEVAGRRLLDFGCGAGGFLVEAKRAGFDVMGLELGEALARHTARTHGVPVFSGQISDADFADERFHVILSSQVFEHLLDPRAALRALRAHLLAPAIVLIEVPNLRDTRERLRRGAMMDDSHLFYFSRRSLGRLLEQEGFRVLEVEQGLRPWRFLGRSGLDRTPSSLLHAGERLLSAAGLRTGLSVFACLENPPPG